MASPAIPNETQHATGPRTLEGKARSSQNARKHGFSAQTLDVLPREQAEFDVYQNELLDLIKPQDGIQADLFRHLIHAGWSLRRLERYELEILEEGNPFKSGEAQSCLDRLERYRAAHRRAYSRTLAEIRKLQTDAMLWSTTHEVIRAKKQNEFPMANPATRDATPHMRTLSDQMFIQDGIRLVGEDESSCGAHFSKTNSGAEPSTGARAA